MQIEVNGEARSIADEATVSDLLKAMDLGTGKGIAIAVNADVVRRADWDDVQLKEGDRVNVIRAVQGG